MLEADRVKSLAQASGLEAARIGVWRTEDIAPAFESLINKADALYVVSDALIAANRTLIVTLALSGRLPTIMSYDDYVKAGGLMSYGPDFPDLFRKAAEMVDKILRGTKWAPADSTPARRARASLCRPDDRAIFARDARPRAIAFRTP